MFGFQIHDLPADHAIDRSRAARDLLDDAHARLRRTLQPGHHFIGLRLQRVPGQDRDRLAEHFVAGRPPAPQVVVVERGKIIVNQRVGVQHLERRAQFLDSVWATIRPPCARLHAEHRPQALAAGKHAVAHGLVNGDGMLRL
jgi:hypothetical protein